MIVDKMKDVYYLTLLVITALGSSLTTMYLPAIKARIKQYRTRIKRKPAIDATTYIELLSRIEDIEKRLDKRQSNFRWVVKDEIKNILLELKDGN